MNVAEVRTLYPEPDNEIHPTAKIGKNVRLGRFNRIGAGVSIEGDVVIGDCNEINENVRMIGPGPIHIGDWNKIHNNALLMGGKSLTMGHNCWIGQNTVLDGTGELEIGNGVIAGMYSQIWTHVSKGEQIEGCNLLAFRPTKIEDEVWLVGSCIVGSGLTLGVRSIAMIGSVLTKDTLPHTVYAGVPAKRTGLNFYKPIPLDEKFGLMVTWCEEFCEYWNGPRYYNIYDDVIQLGDSRYGETLYIAKSSDFYHSVATVLYLNTKTYTKRLGRLERDFLKFLLGNKARFIPQ